jgi:ATP-binding cassette, subfamily C (CFTR/MRP), member 1
MINITSGRILVSDLATSTLCVDKLRKGIAGVPQDTFILPGSVRDNFRIYRDCGGQHEHGHGESYRCSGSSGHDYPRDEEYLLTALMVDSLTAVGLYEKIIAAGGLDCASIGLSTLLSHGERQLFNLARLTVTASPIIVMDEVTSSMDDEMRGLARAFIRERFRGKTIIEVVHRLGSLAEDDWDAYVLMDSGKVVETADLKVEGRGPKFAQILTSSDIKV